MVACSDSGTLVLSGFGEGLDLGVGSWGSWSGSEVSECLSVLWSSEQQSVGSYRLILIKTLSKLNKKIE